MTLDTTIGLFDVLQHAKYPDNTVFNLITTHHRRDDLHHFDCNLVKLGQDLILDSAGVDQPLSYARIQLPNLCCFAIGTKDGFKVFNSNTGRLCYERAIGAFAIVEMLFSSSLLAIVGAGEEILNYIIMDGNLVCPAKMGRSVAVDIYNLSEKSSLELRPFIKAV